MREGEGPVAVQGGVKLEEGVANDLQPLVAHMLEAALGHDGFQEGQCVWQTPACMQSIVRKFFVQYTHHAPEILEMAEWIREIY